MQQMVEHSKPIRSASLTGRSAAEHLFWRWFHQLKTVQLLKLICLNFCLYLFTASHRYVCNVSGTTLCIFSCGSNSINTAVYLSMYLSFTNFLSVNETSTEARPVGVQTPAHVYTQCTEFFSMAQTNLEDFYNSRNSCYSQIGGAKLDRWLAYQYQKGFQSWYPQMCSSYIADNDDSVVGIPIIIDF